MNTVECRVGSVDKGRVTRCGYTGEDGFELAVPNDKVGSGQQFAHLLDYY